MEPRVRFSGDGLFPGTPGIDGLRAPGHQPPTDGGHMLFFGFEAILRRPVPLRVREVASLLGLALPFFKVFLGAHFLLGMGVLGTLIGLPFGWSARAAAATRGLNALIGCASAALGLWVMYSTGIVAVRG